MFKHIFLAFFEQNKNREKFQTFHQIDGLTHLEKIAFFFFHFFNFLFSYSKKVFSFL